MAGQTHAREQEMFGNMELSCRGTLSKGGEGMAGGEAGEPVAAHGCEDPRVCSWGSGLSLP